MIALHKYPINSLVNESKGNDKTKNNHIGFESIFPFNNCIKKIMSLRPSADFVQGPPYITRTNNLLTISLFFSQKLDNLPTPCLQRKTEFDIDLRLEKRKQSGRYFFNDPPPSRLNSKVLPNKAQHRHKGEVSNFKRMHIVAGTMAIISLIFSFQSGQRLSNKTGKTVLDLLLESPCLATCWVVFWE